MINVFIIYYTLHTTGQRLVLLGAPECQKMGHSNYGYRDTQVQSEIVFQQKSIDFLAAVWASTNNNNYTNIVVSLFHCFIVPLIDGIGEVAAAVAVAAVNSDVTVSIIRGRCYNDDHREDGKRDR
jgi:hypothetical protein